MFRLPRRTIPAFILSLLCVTAAVGGEPKKSPSPPPPHIEAIRFWSFGDVTRVAIQTEGDYKLTFDQLENPARLYFDLAGLKPPIGQRRRIGTIQVGDRRVRQIRVAQANSTTTRVVFDLEGPAQVVSSQLVNPDRLMVEIRPKSEFPSTSVSVTHSLTGSERARPVTAELPAETPDLSQVPPPPAVSTVPRNDSPSPGVDAVVNAPLANSRLSPPKAKPPVVEEAKLDVDPDQTSVPPIKSRTPRTKTQPDVATPAKVDSTGDRSLVRVFGLKLGKVVIDAGHGGHDTGTIGPHGLMEKDLVLDVALRLGKLIQQQLGARVIYTRSEDIFIPLEERTKIANEEKADLFISIHANSSPVASATGVETYYFNFTSDKSGIDLATRENATSSSSISDLNELLHNAVLKAKLEESREFAQRVQTSLSLMSMKMNSRSRDRGVRKAPFVVLIGATMPSILAEVGFVSNPHDETLLKRTDQRQKIADALFKGISQYASSLSHTQIARNKPVE